MSFVAKAKYESHTVQTEDGYTLTLLRVQSSAPSSQRKPPVLIVHGLISCGTHWFMNTPEKDLPHKLCQEGYDCWIANLRGTPLSRGHSTISPDSSRFWNFSWHEMGKYDVPAMIQYILDHDRCEKLLYVGHSMGCAVFFAALALRPELNEKIHLSVMLAPCVYGLHIRNRIARMSFPVLTLLGKLKAIYAREMFATTLISYAKKIIPFLTLSPEKVGSWILKTCAISTGVMGLDQIEKHRMMHIALELPSPTSLKTFCHGSQCFQSGKFQQYDYGKIGNYKHYGEPTPPLYDLSKTVVKVATFWSMGDQLCTVNDVTLLAKELPNLIGSFGVHHDDFAHTDFMFGKDADRLVYDRVLDLFTKHAVPDRIDPASD